MKFSGLKQTFSALKTTTAAIRSLFLAFIISFPAVASIQYMKQDGEWISAYQTEDRLTQGRTVTRNVKKGREITLDVFFSPAHSCDAGPAVDFRLVGLHPDMINHAMGVYSENGRKPIKGVPHPKMKVSFAGGGISTRPVTWTVKGATFSDQVGVYNEYNMVVPLHSHVSGISQPIVSIKRANVMNAELVLYRPEGKKIVERTFKASFSLKGSSKAINRAAALCANIKAGKRPDSGLDTGVHQSQIASNSQPQRLDRVCKATIKDLYQYQCDALIIADETGIGYVDPAKIPLCKAAAANVNNACPPDTLRQVLMSGY